MAAGDVYRELGEAAWAWVAGQVRGDDGPWLPVAVSSEEQTIGPGADRDSLYAGIAGLAPVLAEIGQCRALTAAEQALTAGIIARLSAKAVTRAEPSLYDGLAGDVAALKLLAPGRERVALDRLAELMTPDGWPSTLGIEPDSAAPVTDLVCGTAGVVLSGSGPATRTPAMSPWAAARPYCGRPTRPREAWTGGCDRDRGPGIRTTRTAPPG